MKTLKKIMLFFIISFYIVILTGCNNQQNYSMEDKVTEEIRYMENKMIGIVNNFAFGNYERNNVNGNVIESSNDDNTIIFETRIYDTDRILDDTRKIEEASNRIMVDLATENVDNEEITKLSDGINRMISTISPYDEREYLIELNNVFALLPNFEAKVSSDSDEIFERRLKYFTISSYISFIAGDKELAKTQVETLESEYLEKQKGVEYALEHKYNLNKIYLLIEELKKGIEADSETLVKEKYLLLIDEI